MTTEENKEEQNEEPKRYVDLAGTAKASTKASLFGGTAEGPQGQPLQFISMEVEKAQILVDDPDNPGEKVIVQQPSGYITIRARVMAEFCYDEKGNKLATPEKPGDQWQPFNVPMHRKRAQNEVTRLQTGKKANEK